MPVFVIAIKNEENEDCVETIGVLEIVMNKRARL